jgi:hypothetical protein
MSRLAHALGILFGTLALFEADAQTQRPPIADLLLKEPVSLMDWGMMRAKQEIDQAVERLNKEIDEEVVADPRWRTMSFDEFEKDHNKSIKEYTKSHPEDPYLKSYGHAKYYFNSLGLRQFNYKYHFGYAGWSGQQQRIVIGVAVEPFPRDAEQNPASPDFDRGFRPRESFLTADGCTDLLHDVRAGLLWAYGINNPARLMSKWFSHNGVVPSALDQIVAITNIEVNLSFSGDFVEGGETQPELACSQALNGGSATVHDHRQKK